VEAEALEPHVDLILTTPRLRTQMPRLRLLAVVVVEVEAAVDAEDVAEMRRRPPWIP
jgi:hypothetical protein